MLLSRSQLSWFLAIVLITLSGCGNSFDSDVDLNERMVPVDSGSATLDSEEPGDQAPNTEEENGEVVAEAPVQGPLVSLREQILANSSVPQKALDNAFAYYNKNQSVIRNKKYISIFDIGQHSGQRRLYLINVETGAVQSMHVAHGSGSDSNHDGVATTFSNTSGSHMSSLGFMLTAETYNGKHGESLRLDGLESRNSNVRARAIVVHSASYVDPNLSKMGRSQGCPAVSLANIKDFMAKTKNGSLYYIYHSAHD
jgi:hypothetical protein